MGVINLTKAHKELIERLTRDGFAVTPLRYTKGDHVRVRVSKDERAGDITLPGSPGDRKTWHQVVRNARLATAADRSSGNC